MTPIIVFHDSGRKDDYTEIIGLFSELSLANEAKNNFLEENEDVEESEVFLLYIQFDSSHYLDRNFWNDR